MGKILFQIKDNSLYVKLRKRLNTEQKNLINTNVISQNELVFSEEYIKENLKLIHNFVKELVKSYNLDTLIIKESTIATTILQIIANITEIKNLYLLEESILTYDICDKIIKTNTISYVSLYNLPTFLLEMLDKEKIKVDSRNEILFLSNFMEDNNLQNFSSLYYKTSITINLPMTENDEEDFNSFININKYLKTIYINKLNKNDLENILEILYTHRLRNIKILIEDNIHDIELIEYLKKINKKNAKINGIQFKIDYSKEYLEDNLMNQIHLNTIKMCIFIALFFVSSLVVYVFYSNYVSMQNVEDIQKDISSVIAEYKENHSTNEPDEDIIEPIEDNEINENDSDNSNNDDDNPKENYKPKYIRTDIAGLLEINKDTVGWLKVNNTNIDYPVVQAEDNDYYLKRNFKGEKDNSGWIFMDYRANPTDLSRNTIIFGHNMYYSGVMFGTLYKAKYSNWYKNPDNQIIEFDTLYDEYDWQIFSIYVVPNTDDYLIANFSSDAKFQEYLDLIINRSIYAFNAPVSTKDHILTLSTCSDNGKNRLVIHAVLLES